MKRSKIGYGEKNEIIFFSLISIHWFLLILIVEVCKFVRLLEHANIDYGSRGTFLHWTIFEVELIDFEKNFKKMLGAIPFFAPTINVCEVLRLELKRGLPEHLYQKHPFVHKVQGPGHWRPITETGKSTNEANKMCTLLQRGILFVDSQDIFIIHPLSADTTDPETTGAHVLIRKRLGLDRNSETSSSSDRINYKARRRKRDTEMSTGIAVNYKSLPLDWKPSRISISPFSSVQRWKWCTHFSLFFLPASSNEAFECGNTYINKTTNDVAGDIRFKRDATTVTSPVPPLNTEIYVETAVFVDKDLYNHMTTTFPVNTEKELIRFVLALINAVSTSENMRRDILWHFDLPLSGVTSKIIDLSRDASVSLLIMKSTFHFQL